jgi:hypothetical protein
MVNVPLVQNKFNNIGDCIKLRPMSFAECLLGKRGQRYPSPTFNVKEEMLAVFIKKQAMPVVRVHGL